MKRRRTIFIKGKGEFQIGDHIFPVSEGTVVCVALEGVRCWHNLSVEPLYNIVVQSPVGDYKGSGTINDGTAVQKPVRWGLSNMAFERDVLKAARSPTLR